MNEDLRADEAKGPFLHLCAGSLGAWVTGSDRHGEQWFVHKDAGYVMPLVCASLKQEVYNIFIPRLEPTRGG